MLTMLVSVDGSMWALLVRALGALGAVRWVQSGPVQSSESKQC